MPLDRTTPSGVLINKAPNATPAMFPDEIEVGCLLEERSSEDNPDADPPGDPKFDRWLESELLAEFGAVSAEPIPESLLNLIEIHRRGKH